MRRHITGLIVAAAAAGASVLAAAPASAAPGIIYVTDLDGGQGYTAYPVGAGTAELDDAAGPDGTPGSLRLDSPGGSDKVQVFTTVSGKPGDLSALSYSTYRQASSTASDVQTTALNVTAFCNAAGPNTGFASFVFEPVYNFGDENPASVVEGAWQTWDAYDGGDAVWWTSKYISTTAGGGISNGPAAGFVGGPDDFVSYTTLTSRFATACPDAAALQIGFNQGSGNSGLSVNVDALAFDFGSRSETADFSPAVPLEFTQTESFGATQAGAAATAAYLVSSAPNGLYADDGAVAIGIDDVTAAELASCTVSVDGGPANPVEIEYDPTIEGVTYSGALIYAASDLIIEPGFSLPIAVSCQTTAAAQLGDYELAAVFTYGNQDLPTAAAQVLVEPGSIGTLADILSITAAPSASTAPTTTAPTTTAVPAPSSTAVLAATGPGRASVALRLGLIVLAVGAAMVGLTAARRGASAHR